MGRQAAPNSGFFSLHRNADGVALYPDEMAYVYNMQNSSGGVNAHCAAALAGTPEAWKCIFANFSYAHSVGDFAIIFAAFLTRFSALHRSTRAVRCVRCTLRVPMLVGG